VGPVSSLAPRVLLGWAVASVSSASVNRKQALLFEKRSKNFLILEGFGGLQDTV
jgi:hypothetical protein